MGSMFGPTIVGVAALACATGAIAGRTNGDVGRQAYTAAGGPVVVADPALVRLGGSASVTVRGLTGRRLEVRLAGATTLAGAPLGWRPLHLAGKVWRGSLPTPTLRGIYPIEVRAGAGRPVARSTSWMLRVFAAGTLSRPSFATPEGVAKWWVRTATGHARLVALRRWPRPGFDLRDQRLHQLLVVAYSRVGHPGVDDRLGMFVTAVRNGFDGRWCLLEATLRP
jgi:hypothetical protein